MKISILILISVCLVLNLESTRGDLVQNLFGTVHKTATKVSDDLSGILKLNKDKGVQTDKNKAEVSKQDVVSQKPEDEVKISTVTFPTDAPETVESRPVPSSTPKMSAKSDGPGEGKENFAAGCITGYVRTPDGRCMPTY